MSPLGELKVLDISFSLLSFSLLSFIVLLSLFERITMVMRTQCNRKKDPKFCVSPEGELTIILLSFSLLLFPLLYFVYFLQQFD